MSAVVTDLTYVRVGTNWAYICLMIDLFNREIIGHSCGNKKDAQLVKRAIQSIPYSLQEIELFHTDRGKEFDNQTIQNLMNGLVKLRKTILEYVQQEFPDQLLQQDFDGYLFPSNDSGSKSPILFTS